MSQRSHLLSAAALFAAGVIATAAHASTIISIGVSNSSSGPITTLATDSATPGSASFVGTYGGYLFNNISGTGAPLTGQGTLQTASLQVSTPAAPASGTLYVYVTEQGLTSPAGLTSFLSSFTSNAFTGNVTSVVESTYFSNSNALYDGSLLASDTFTGIGTGMSTNTGTITGTYSETVRYAITGGPGAGSVNDTVNLGATAVTPEPSSLALLGTGLVGIAGMALRRRKLIA